MLKETVPETILFETLHPLGFNSTQIKDIANSLHGQSGKQFASKEWRVIKDREFLLLEEIRSEEKDIPPFQLKKRKNTRQIFRFHGKKEQHVLTLTS